MKKSVIVLLAVTVILSLTVVFVGCNCSGSNKAATDPTATIKATATVNTQSSTQSQTQTQKQSENSQSQTQAQNESQAQTQAPVQPSQGSQDDTQSGDTYAGLTSQDVIDKVALTYGSGYQVIELEQSYLRNDEAWHVVIEDRERGTQYGLYVKADEMIPQSADEIPYRD